MADWRSFEIEIPGKDLLEPVREILETLLIFLEILRAILETIKLFLIDFGNPLRALLEALIKLIQELFEALKSTGLFAYFDLPGLASTDAVEDPSFAKFLGGFDSFTTRLKGSLFDLKDFNRPQPRAGSTKSGFILFVVDASNIIDFIRKILFLMKFFGKAWSAPRFEAPENFKAIPVGASGDPILRLADTFTTLDSVGAKAGPIEAIQLQWTLPSTVESSDPGFSDIVTKMAFEIVPPSFVIEKSVGINPAATKIDLADAGDSEATGLVQFNRKTDFVDRTNTRVDRIENVTDNSGEPFIKFQRYIVAPAATIAFGLLGKFRYIDTDVEVDKIYYYRCRAFLGDLDVSGDDKLQNIPTTERKLTHPIENGGTVRFLSWPSKDADSSVIMGKPTGILASTIGTDAGDFDPYAVCVALFKSALSLDFHQPLQEDAEFDEEGFPIPDTQANEVGRSSLLGLGSAVIPIQGINIIRTLNNAETVNDAIAAGPGGGVLEMPYQGILLRLNANRLAGIVVSAMMQQPGIVFQFRSLMRGSFPNGALSFGNLEATKNLEEAVFAFVKVDENGDVIPQETEAGDDNEFGTEDDETHPGVPFGVQTFFEGYDDAIWRLNVLTAINFIKSFTLGGTPPNWTSIVPLRDIIPWGAQIIYDLLDKIDALLAAFAGLMDEIRDFIDLLIKKIESLEEFIQFLIDILDFIESLKLSVFMLSVGSMTGGVEEWVEQIDNAGGDAPTSGPNGLSGGIALAYVAVDIAAFQTAFGIIFGAE